MCICYSAVLSPTCAANCLMQAMRQAARLQPASDDMMTRMANVTREEEATRCTKIFDRTKLALERLTLNVFDLDDTKNPLEADGSPDIGEQQLFLNQGVVQVSRARPPLSPVPRAGPIPRCSPPCV